jgi:mannose-1-phosphate guanylyltransferase
VVTVACVLAGGTGTRLYPAARPARPKQFLSLGGPDDRSLLARTVDRVSFADRTLVSTRPDLEAGVRARVDADVVVEPAPRDTGPAVAYVTHRLHDRGDDPVVLVCPSDHAVGDDAAFRRTAERAVRVADRTGRLVTLGVAPTRPDPGYGYLEPGTERDGWRVLARFHEKPDRATAADYLDRGFRWNAGVFAWRASAFLDAARDSPLAPLLDALDRGDPEAGFATVPSVSVDEAVMEDAAARDEAALVPADLAWDDLGTWDAVGRHAPVVEGNAALAPLAAVDATDNVVYADDGTHVSLVGVDGLAVVAADDRVLVVPRDRANEVRALVDRLRGD